MKRRDVLAAGAASFATLAMPRLLRAQIAAAASKALPSLKVSTPAEAVSLDPSKIVGGNDVVFVSNIFEGLYVLDLDGKPAPGLAESVKISEDGLTYDFQLKKALFHNGDPFTAEDVRFSWQRALQPDLRSPRAAVVLENIRDIEVVDDHLARVKLKERDPALLTNCDAFWYIIPKKYIERVGADGFAANPVGTGPYAVVERRVKQYTKFRAFQQHWGRAPKVNELTLQVVPDNQTRMTQIQTGEVDAVTNVPPFMARALQRDPNIKVIANPSFNNQYLQFNLAAPSPRVTNHEIRKALIMSVDRPAMLKTVMFGYGQMGETNCSKGLTGCSTDVEPFKYDPKAARALLEKNKFDFSQPLIMVGPTTGRYPQSQEILEAVSHYFSQVGVKTTLDIMEWGSFVARQGEPKKKPDFDLFLITFPDYNSDPSGRLVRNVRGGAAFSFYANPKVDSLIDGMNKATTEAERNKMIGEVFKLWHDDAANIPFWQADSIYAIRKDMDWSPTKYVTWPILWNLKKSDT